jgi:uncharacterized protein (TIGR02757 family)
MKLTYQKLESLYDEYNKFCYIHPDPLEFLYNYDDVQDKEIAGLIASSLAYGNVKQILKSVSIVLNKMGSSPYCYISANDKGNYINDFQGFKHRFTTCKDLVSFLSGIKEVLREYTSLQNCFNHCITSSNSNFINAISLFTEIFNKYYDNSRSFLLPSPKNGSACKRLMLYLRWMIRKDDVDPGCWNDTISPSKLIIPLDTHMFNISKQFGFTTRKTADFKTAIEITNTFAAVNPIDPVKYDFSLTRFGIRDELAYSDIK